MTLEQRIAHILKTSEFDCCVFEDHVLLALAREIIDGLEHHGWEIEHTSFRSIDE